MNETTAKMTTKTTNKQKDVKWMKIKKKQRKYYNIILNINLYNDSNGILVMFSGYALQEEEEEKKDSIQTNPGKSRFLFLPDSDYILFTFC